MPARATKSEKFVMLPKRNEISNSTYYLDYFSPVDSLLVYRYDGKEVAFGPLTKTLEKILMKPINYNASIRNDYADPFQGDQRLIRAAETLRSFGYLGNYEVYAKLKNRSELRMDTWHIGLIAPEYRSSPEGLMAAPSDGLEQPALEVVVNEHGSIYGPLMLAVLEEIGWPTRRSPNPVKLKIVLPSVPFAKKIKHFFSSNLFPTLGS